MLIKSKYTALICGAISVIVTIAGYFLMCDTVFSFPIRWLSLISLIVAEMIATMKAMVVRKNIFGVAHLTASTAHLLLVLITSVVFVNLFPLMIKSYIFINVLALSVLAITDVMLIFFAERVQQQNDRMCTSQSITECSFERAEAMSITFGNTEHKEALEEIADLLKYSDNSCSLNGESVIMDQLIELEELLSKNSDDAKEKIADIKNTIQLRSAKIKTAKRGRF